MERSEIIDILARMNALPADADALDSAQIEFDAYRLAEDPIVSNRIAVEAIQQLPRDHKFDVVLAANEQSELFAYALAMAAWARFACADDAGLVHGYRIEKGEKVLIVDTLTDDATSYEDAVDLIADKKAKLAGAITLVSLGDAAPLPEHYYPLLRFED